MFVNMLLYGASGVGKTTFGAKSPEPLILDFEAGTLSVRNMSVMVASPRTLDDVRKTIKRAEKKGVETLILDSVTEMQRHFMNEVMSEIVRKDPRKSIFSPTLEAWGIVTEMMRYVIRTARDADMHTIFIALETLEKKEQDDKVFARPALTPKVTDDICAYVDIVGRLAMVKKERVLLLTPSSEYVAKDRSGVLPDTLEGDELAFQTIIDLVTGLEPDEDDVEEADEEVSSEGEGNGDDPNA